MAKRKTARATHEPARGGTKKTKKSGAAKEARSAGAASSRKAAPAKRAAKTAPKKKSTGSGWGGARPGAGRKPGKRPSTPHRTRLDHDSSCPVHLSIRRAKGLPSLRASRIFRVVAEHAALPLAGEGHVLAVAVEPERLHVLLTAGGRDELTTAARSFTIRIARRLNAVLGRSGHIWDDRYRARDLTSAEDVRGVLASTFTEAGAPAKAGKDEPFHAFATAFEGGEEDLSSELRPSRWLRRDGKRFLLRARPTRG